jgi:hypothetical protein
MSIWAKRMEADIRAARAQERERQLEDNSLTPETLSELDQSLGSHVVDSAGVCAGALVRELDQRSITAEQGEQ